MKYLNNVPVVNLDIKEMANNVTQVPKKLKMNSTNKKNNIISGRNKPKIDYDCQKAILCRQNF